MELSKTFRFEASHILPKHPGKCSRLHGHSWVLTVFVEGPVDFATGFVMDFAIISKLVKPLVERLDHRHLGTWPFVALAQDPWWVEGLPNVFYPTSENLLLWLGEQLLVPQVWGDEPSGKIGHILEWSKLTLNETCTSSTTLTREEFDRNANKNKS